MLPRKHVVVHQLEQGWGGTPRAEVGGAPPALGHTHRTLLSKQMICPCVNRSAVKQLPQN